MRKLRCAPLILFLAPLLFAQCGSGCNPGPTPGVPPDGYAWVFDVSTCSYDLVWLGPSPIVIDTDGTGFHLTSAADGVLFDFYGDGKPIQIAWTAKGSTNGWLALPKNGQITSARDLFGNISPQPLTKAHPPNGFAALAIYDTSAYGGNNDGVIDSKDAVWSKLRVWIDANHDGVSQPEELHTLEEIGISGTS